MNNKTIKIGNTFVNHRKRYDGSPYPSDTVNRRVLLRLFPNSEPVESDREDAVAIEVSPDKKMPESEGQPIRVEVENDLVLLRYIYSPQMISELKKGMHATAAMHEKIEAEFLKAYGYIKKPIVYTEIFNFNSHGVPCVEWLKSHCQISSSAIDLEKYIPSNAAFDLRMTGIKFAIHIFPPGTEGLTKELKDKLELINGFEIGIGSAEDWNNGIAVVATRIRDTNPFLFIKILELVTS